VPHVASPTKPYTVKPSQSQAARPPQANERPQAALESMIDDNAANPPAAAKDQSATDRAQNRPAAKAKPAKSTDNAKPADGERPAKAANADKADKTDKPAETGKTDATDKPATEAKAEDAAPTEPATDPATVTAATDPAAAQAAATIIMPDGTLAVALPVQTPTPAEAQPATATAEEAQAPVIAALAGETPVDPAATQDKNAPTGKDKPAAAAQAADGEEATGKPAAQAQPANGKAPHVALSDAEKELVARARGEGSDNAQRAGKETAQTDTQAPTPKAVTDLPTPQLHTPTHTTAGATASTATAAAPQTAAQTPVPLAGVPVEIATKARDGKTNFDIRLDPPELGRIEVRLNIDRDGNVTSRLIADRPETLDLLRRDSSGLERALQDAGLKTSDNGMQFSLRDQSLSQQQDNGNKNGADTAHVIAQDDTLPIIDTPVQSYGRLAGRGGGLDIRV